METTIYKAGCSVFIPTKEVVQQDYANGKKGEQLWIQMFEGYLCGNMWTKKEILSLNPTVVTFCEY